MYGQAALRQQSRQPRLSTRESIEARVGRFCGGPSDQRPGDDDSWATRPPTDVCTKNDESGVCVDHWRPAGGRACACLATSGRCARSEGHQRPATSQFREKTQTRGTGGGEGRKEETLHVCNTCAYIPPYSGRSQLRTAFTACRTANND